MSVDVANPLAQGVCALGDGMRRKKRRPPGPGTTANAATTATSGSPDEAVDVAIRRKHNADDNVRAAAP